MDNWKELKVPYRFSLEACEGIHKEMNKLGLWDGLMKSELLKSGIKRFYNLNMCYNI